MIKAKFSRTRTVASVTAGLTSMVEDLQAVGAEQRAEVTRQNEVIENAKHARDAAIDEADKAFGVAAKIAALFE